MSKRRYRVLGVESTGGLDDIAARLEDAYNRMADEGYDADGWPEEVTKLGVRIGYLIRGELPQDGEPKGLQVYSGKIGDMRSLVERAAAKNQPEEKHPLDHISSRVKLLLAPAMVDSVTGETRSAQDMLAALPQILERAPPDLLIEARDSFRLAAAAHEPCHEIGCELSAVLVGVRDAVEAHLSRTMS